MEFEKEGEEENNFQEEADEDKLEDPSAAVLVAVPTA